MYSAFNFGAISKHTVSPDPPASEHCVCLRDSLQRALGCSGTDYSTDKCHTCGASCALQGISYLHVRLAMAMCSLMNHRRQTGYHTGEVGSSVLSNFQKWVLGIKFWGYMRACLLLKYNIVLSTLQPFNVFFKQKKTKTRRWKILKLALKNLQWCDIRERVFFKKKDIALQIN